MSSYIESEWLKGRVHDVTLANGALHGCIDKLDIHEAPSINICFCGECKKRKKNKFCLEHMRYEKDDNGFCSYGERNSENLKK